MHKPVALALLLFAWGISGQAFAAKAPHCDEPRLCHDDELAVDIINLLSPTEQVFASVGNHPTRAVSVAAEEVIWQHARDAADVEVRAIAAGRLIDIYLLVGMSSDAFNLFESLDAGARERVTAGPVVFGRAEISESSDFFLDQSPTLTAAGLATAYAEAGRMGDADKLLEVAAKPIAGDPEDRGLRSRTAPIAGICAKTLIHAGAKTDWFLWVFGNNQHDRDLAGCSGAVPARAYERLAAQHLSVSGLPEHWLRGAEPNEQPGVHAGDQDKLDAALKKLPKARERITQLKAELAKIDHQDGQWIALWKKQQERDRPGNESPKHNEPSATDHELAKTIAARLARPVFNPYRIEDADAKAVIKKTTNSKPCAHRVIRCIDVGQVRWELLLSQDYDPTGEVPAAGYWLRRTELPNGQPRSFYLGIKEHMPFELVESKDPFIVDGELRLLVRRAAIDPKKIMFPPLGLEFKGEKNIHVLRAKLDDIIKDSDGDGLTDLAEQQLLLDPMNPDTDGDGIPEGKDSLPNVAFQKEPTARQRAFAAALPFLTHEPDLAISFGVPGADTFVRRRSSDERTLFVIADPEDVAGISAGRRIVVIPTSLNFKLLNNHPAFSLFFPMSISLRMLEDGKHAELTYSAGWRGGTLAMELRDGVWRIGTLSGWIT